MAKANTTLGFLGNAKTEKTETAKTKTATAKTEKVAKAIYPKKSTGDSIKIKIPRNPKAAYELGLYMARYQ